MARVASIDAMSSPREKERLAERIGKSVRAQRKASKLTLSEAGERAGLSISHFSNIENGRTLASLPVLARIATALHTSLAALTRDEDRLIVQISNIPEEPGVRAKLSHPMLQLEAFAERLRTSELIDLPLPPGEKDLFIFVLEGEALVSIDAVAYDLGAEDALDARAPHSASIRALSDIRLLWAVAPTQQL